MDNLEGCIDDWLDMAEDAFTNGGQILKDRLVKLLMQQDAAPYFNVIDGNREYQK